MGFFHGGTTDRDTVAELQARVARLEDQVAGLLAGLEARSGAAQAPPSSAATEMSSADSGDDPGDRYPEARALAASGRKIQAIQAVREQGGMSLKAAKDLVESW